MPIRYMPLTPLPTSEFVEPNASDAFIWWLFKHRCIVCKKDATEINEIIPRSRSRKSIQDWTNRVTLCRECHNDYHRHGVNDEAIDEMKQQRVDFLMSFGRSEYVEFYPVSNVTDPLMKKYIDKILPDGLEYITNLHEKRTE